MAKTEPPKHYTEKSLAWELFGGRATVFVVLAMIAMSLGVIGFGVYDVYQNQKFEFQGIRTQGTITGKEIKPGNDPRGNSTSFWVSYNYKDVNGALVSVTANSQQAFNRVNQGDVVTVEYIPGESGRSRLVDFSTSPWVSRAAAGGFGLLFGLAAVAIGILGRRSARRRAKLIFHGDARQGQIVRLEQKGAGKTRRLLVTYKFTDAAGVERESKPEPITVKFFNDLKQGQKVTVVIDREDPKRYELDYFGVRS